MNKIVLSLIALSTATVANAQVIIKNTDLMPVDSTVTTYLDTVPTNAATIVGTAGTAKVWDFSAAKMQDYATTKALLPANTTAPSLAVISNYALLRIKGADSVITFYDNTATGLIAKARRLKDPFAYSGLTLNTTYTPTKTAYKFPITIGSSYNLALIDSAVEVINIDMNDIQGGTFKQYIDSVRIILTNKVNYVTDAEGKLKTPQDTNLSVLRMKTYNEMKVHIDVKGAPGNQLGLSTNWAPVTNDILHFVNPYINNDTIMKTYGYEFWSNDSYLPVVKISTLSATDDTARVVEWQKHHATLKALSVKSLVNNVNVKMYPNPTASLVYIATNANVTTAVITDIAGRTIAKLPVTNNTIDVSTLNNGNYIITLLNNANVAIANATVMVSK